MTISVEEIHDYTGIDRWFLDQLVELIAKPRRSGSVTVSSLPRSVAA